MKRARNQTVIARVVNRGKEYAIQPEVSGRFVELVLIAAATRNLDHRRDSLRRMRSDR